MIRRWSGGRLKPFGSKGVQTSFCASGFLGFVFRRASSRLRKTPRGARTSCSSQASYMIRRWSGGRVALSASMPLNESRKKASLKLLGRSDQLWTTSSGLLAEGSQRLSFASSVLARDSCPPLSSLHPREGPTPPPIASDLEPASTGLLRLAELLDMLQDDSEAQEVVVVLIEGAESVIAQHVAIVPP